MISSMRDAIRTLVRRGLAIFATTLLVACTITPPTTVIPGKSAADGDRQRHFADSVNAYRAARGATRIPLLPTLMAVARAHLEDLERRYQRGTQCNMHSWSNAGNWSPCCYTPDHAAAACMWNKPRELSGGRYRAPGYEIAAHYTDPITPTRALLIWQDSPPHREMLLNRAQWTRHPWQAMGAAIGRHYAVVWFAEERDSATD